MAEGLLRHLAGDRFEVFSAGIVGSFVRVKKLKRRMASQKKESGAAGFGDAARYLLLMSQAKSGLLI